MAHDLKPGQLKILKAVATLLENPSTKITISNVAREVGVTDAAIYRHYRSKEQIFQALMDYMEMNFLTPLNAAQQESGDTKQQLASVYERYMEFFAGHPGLARLFMGHGTSEGTGLAGRIQMLHAKLRSQVAQILRRGEAQKVLSAGVSPEQGTELFYGLIAAAAMAVAFSLPQLESQERWQAYAGRIFV